MKFSTSLLCSWLTPCWINPKRSGHDPFGCESSCFAIDAATWHKDWDTFWFVSTRSRSSTACRTPLQISRLNDFHCLVTFLYYYSGTHKYDKTIEYDTDSIRNWRFFEKFQALLRFKTTGGEEKLVWQREMYHWMPRIPVGKFRTMSQISEFDKTSARPWHFYGKLWGLAHKDLQERWLFVAYCCDNLAPVWGAS